MLCRKRNRVRARWCFRYVLAAKELRAHRERRQPHIRRYRKTRYYRPQLSQREVQSYIPHRRQPVHLGDTTMKVLCISKWAKPPSPGGRVATLPKEFPATLKLYLDG